MPDATQDEQNMPAVLVRAAVSEFRRTGHWPCDVFMRMAKWVDENTPPRWREGEDGKDGR